MSDFNLDVPIVQALIADAQSCSVVECATAWLTTYRAAQERGAEEAGALVEAAAAWDRTAAEWRPHTADDQTGDGSLAHPPTAGTCDPDDTAI